MRLVGVEPEASRFEREVGLTVALPELIQKLTYTIAKVGQVLANAQGAIVITDEAAYNAWRAQQDKGSEPPPLGTRPHTFEDFLEPSVVTYRRRVWLEEEKRRGGFVAPPTHLRDILDAIKYKAINPEALAWLEPYLDSIQKQLELS